MDDRNSLSNSALLHLTAHKLFPGCKVLNFWSSLLTEAERRRLLRGVRWKKKQKKANMIRGKSGEHRDEGAEMNEQPQSGGPDPDGLQRLNEKKQVSCLKVLHPSSKKSFVLKIPRPSGDREEPWHNTTKSNSYLTSVSHCRISSADAPWDCQFLPLWANLCLEEMEIKSSLRGKKPQSCQLKSKSEPKKKRFHLKNKEINQEHQRLESSVGLCCAAWGGPTPQRWR